MEDAKRAAADAGDWPIVLKKSGFEAPWRYSTLVAVFSSGCGLCEGTEFCQFSEVLGDGGEVELISCARWTA